MHPREWRRSQIGQMDCGWVCSCAVVWVTRLWPLQRTGGAAAGGRLDQETKEGVRMSRKLNLQTAGLYRSSNFTLAMTHYCYIHDTSWIQFWLCTVPPYVSNYDTILSEKRKSNVTLYISVIVNKYHKKRKKNFHCLQTSIVYKKLSMSHIVALVDILFH